MNQILAIEEKNKDKKRKTTNNNQLEIKGIIRFFAIAILMLGVIFAGEGSYAIYKEIDDKDPANIPTIVIGRVNDKAILQIEHNTEISKIVYSWDDGEENTIPIGATSTQEEIMLLGYDSVLNLMIEDVNGRQIKYQKHCLLTGKDITKPIIKIDTQDGNNKMKITAKDENSILYLSYQWEGEDEVVINADTNEQDTIIKEVPLTVGNRNIKIIAEDRNGNVEVIEKEIIISTSRPEVHIKRSKGKINVEVIDKDGIKDIVINLNGKIYEFRDKNAKKIAIGNLILREGNNTFSIELTNINGYTESATTEIKYNP